MEEMHQIDHSALTESALKKYKGKSAKWLCDKTAELTARCKKPNKDELDKITECAVALMKKLKKLSEFELNSLEEYVSSEIEDGNKSYIAVRNVFALKEIFNL